MLSVHWLLTTRPLMMLAALGWYSRHSLAGGQASVRPQAPLLRVRVHGDGPADVDVEGPDNAQLRYLDGRIQQRQQVGRDAVALPT